MALADKVLARMQAQLGQNAPFDSISGNLYVESLATFTPTLVDAVNAEKAWLVSGRGTANLNASHAVNTNGGGVAIVVRYEVITRGSDSDGWVGGIDGDASYAVRKTGSTTVRINHSAGQSLTLPNVNATATGVIHCIAGRITTVSGDDTTEAWYLTAGRVGTDPDLTTTGNTNTRTFTASTIGGFDTGSIRVLDFIVLDSTVTNQEMADMADDLRAVLPLPPPAPVSLLTNVPEQNPLVTGEWRLDISTFFTGGFPPNTYAVVSGAVTIENDSEIVIAQPTAGTLPTSVTGIVIRATDTDTNTADTNAFDVVWDVSPWGIRGDLVPSSGDDGPSLLYADLNLPTENADRFSYTLDVAPTTGTLNNYWDGTFVFTPAADGTEEFTYTGYKNGLSYGTATVTLESAVTGGGGSITASIKNISFQNIFNSINSLIDFLSINRQIQSDNGLLNSSVDSNSSDKQYEKDLSNVSLLNVTNVNNKDKQIQRDNSAVGNIVGSNTIIKDFSLDGISTQVINISNISDKHLQTSNSVASNSIASDSVDRQLQKERVLTFLANVVVANNRDTQFQKDNSSASVVNNISVDNRDIQLQKDNLTSSLEIVFTAKDRDALAGDKSSLSLVSAVRVSNQEFQNTYSNLLSTITSSSKDSVVQVSLSEVNSLISLNIQDKQLDKESSRLFLDLVQGIGEGEFVIGILSDGSFIIRP